MRLTETQRRHLRRLGHALDPVVLVGNAGVSPAVLAEIDHALGHHELIKVRVRVEDRKDRDTMLTKLVADSGATLVQRIGHVAGLYRRAVEPKVVLPTPGT